MTIYIDSDYKCHATDDGTRQAVETDFFDGKCDTYIAGYRFVPSGSTWEREDGEVFAGEMVAPVEDWEALDDAQASYEREQYQNLLKELSEVYEDAET